MAKKQEKTTVDQPETPPDVTEPATSEPNIGAENLEDIVEQVGEVVDPTADPRGWPGAIAALANSTGDMHAIYMRLAEIVPFMPGAIAQAEGDIKSFLSTLAAHL